MTQSLTLSRSSGLYKFVFGKHEKKLEGFPEPRNDRISFGIFLGLLLAMLILKPLGSCLFLLMDALFRIVGFMIDGSLVRGSLLDNIQITKIEPWPKIMGKRLTPWWVLAILAISYRFWTVGIGEAGEAALFFVFTTIVFLLIKPGDRSPTEELAEALGSKMDEKIRLSYYREPKFFPALHLVP